MDVEAEMSDSAEVFKELTEEEAERLWTEEAKRRLDEYRADRARAVPSDEVVRKAVKLFR